MSSVHQMDGNGPVRGLLLTGLLFMALGTCGAPFPRLAATSNSNNSFNHCGTIADYYRHHDGRWLWLDPQGHPNPRGQQLLKTLARAGDDGLNPADYVTGAKTDRNLSSTFVHFARDLVKGPVTEPIYYIDAKLRPEIPCASQILERSASTRGFQDLIARLQQPNAVARALRARLADDHDPRQRTLLSSDLALARSMGSPQRFVVVDTSAQQLWMIDEAGPAGTMKVIVGRSGMDTPPMAGLMRFAVVNPYWDIPPDLVRNEVAPRILAQGPAYLTRRNYEPVTSYDDRSAPLEAPSIDWNAVQKGTEKVGIRQLPGPDNMMGRVMFMFPNKFGIYLHDTPGRWVFSRADRRLSHGCVRLEHADSLYQWIFGRPLSSDLSGGPQVREELPTPIPVYILRLSDPAAEVLSRHDS